MLDRAMTRAHPAGAFGHQHGDPRGLLERIEAHLRERIPEAVEMAGARADGGASPASWPPRSRHRARRTGGSSRRLLASSSPISARRFTPSSPATSSRAALEQAEAALAKPEQLFAGQVFLARRLPDYWQRFETHRAAYTQACLQAPPPRLGWLSRLLGGNHAARKPGSDG